MSARRPSFGILSTVTILFVFTSCNNTNDQLKISPKILSLLGKSEACTEKIIDLSDAVSGEYRMVCAQTAYMAKRDFEGLAGVPVPDFTMLENDGEVKLWFFGKDGKSTSLNTTQLGIFNPLSSDNCVSSKSAVVNVSCKAARTYYTLKGL